MMGDATRVLPEEFLEETGEGICTVQCPAKVAPGLTLEEVLVFARRDKASDVHICSGAPVMFRKAGVLKAVTEERFNGDQIAVMLQAAMPSVKWEQAKLTGDTEYVHAIPGAGRFRMTVTRQRFGWDMAARLVDMEIRTFEQSFMPPSCLGLTKWAQGLVLVAGPAGCGKTSTLATLIEQINLTRDAHIITIENPIEIVYKPKKCQISQRALNVHTLSSASALRAALREDPDIIVVSEMRDLEMIQLAVTAAETGHLVLCTMNTNDASQTVSSLINSFSPNEQPIVRNMVAESLRGVICQQLIPRADGTGLVPAYEVLIVIPAVAALIKTGRARMLNNVMATNKNAGMQLLDYAMLELVNKKIISGQEALRRAIDPKMFAPYAGAAGGDRG